MDANTKILATGYWHTPPRITNPSTHIGEKILRSDDLWIQWREKAGKIKQKIKRTQ